jgi:hypothetical protein
MHLALQYDTTTACETMRRDTMSKLLIDLDDRLHALQRTPLGSYSCTAIPAGWLAAGWLRIESGFSVFTFCI